MGGSRLLRTGTVVALCGALLLTACQSSPPEVAPPPIGATEPSEVTDAQSASPTPSESEDEWAVPDEIDETYVEKVILELERLRAQFFAILQDLPEGSEIPPEAIELLKAFNLPVLAEALVEPFQAWVDDPQSPLTDMNAPPGPRIPLNAEVRHATPDCLAALVTWNFDEMFATDNNDGDGVVVVLRPMRQEQGEGNVTGWAYRFETTWSEPRGDRPFTPEDGAELCA